MPPKKPTASKAKAKAPKAGAGGGKAKKKKWSKGKQKERLVNAVLFDEANYKKLLKDIPSQKVITPANISEKLKINMSLARVAVRELMAKGLIRKVIQHHQMGIYTRNIEATPAS
eukprot:gnl/Spiro4/18773_TR10037_c0_g1_i1.p1 gnl/Spiro4/18773_TR10037_c0_g1~~gnl/Spiro4/18773_TR10037_c0_g1_i1.p1  ORF type:complete len:115 (+),score=37.99 gnl/Spiro4/18773_TR10037_c0_g1_i1:46-390(+)